MVYCFWIHCEAKQLNIKTGIYDGVWSFTVFIEYRHRFTTRLTDVSSDRLAKVFTSTNIDAV